MRNGLHYVLVAAMYLVSGISGSKAADIAAVAPALFPEMEKRGADRAELAALLAATGAQTETVPPSLNPDRDRLGDRRLDRGAVPGGLMPALVIGLMLCAGLVSLARRRMSRATRGEIGHALLIALPALLLPFVIAAA